MNIPKTQKIIDFIEQQNSSGGGDDIGHSIFLKIISLENLFFAWENFFRGKRNRSDAQEFYWRLEDNLYKLHNDLRNGGWRHGGYQKFIVCDPKPRVIHKADIFDRILHHAIFQIIEPIFSRSFIFDSWSCRKGKGTHNSVLRCRKKLLDLSENNKKEIWVLKCDIKKYFASIDHKILMEQIGKKIKDDRAPALIFGVISSFAPGVPLGNITSQLFANIYLNTFDHFIRNIIRAPIYLRYSDDFLLAAKTKYWLDSQIPILGNFWVAV